MSACIALLRGINVGRAKRVAMADLRSLMQDLGHAQVRTLLNSGNIVFESRRVGLTHDPQVLAPFKALQQQWHPDALDITSRAAYLWCVKGVLGSPLSQAFSKLAGEGLTTRNWATVLKIADRRGGDVQGLKLDWDPPPRVLSPARVRP